MGNTPQALLSLLQPHSKVVWISATLSPQTGRRCSSAHEEYLLQLKEDSVHAALALWPELIIQCLCFKTHLLHLSYGCRCGAMACLGESTCSSHCIVCTVKVWEAEAVRSHFCVCDEMAMHGLLRGEEEAHGWLMPHLDPLSTANIWNVNPFDNVSRPQKADSALQATCTAEY